MSMAANIIEIKNLTKSYGKHRGIQALVLGLNMVSKETRMRTADFLMSKPVSRSQVLPKIRSVVPVAVGSAFFFFY